MALSLQYHTQLRCSAGRVSTARENWQTLPLEIGASTSLARTLHTTRAVVVAFEHAFDAGATGDRVVACLRCARDVRGFGFGVSARHSAKGTSAAARERAGQIACHFTCARRRRTC